jgi:hypothetical protein
MSCKAESGITNTCADLRKVGGSGKTFWAGYLSELDTPISTAQSADIRTLDFGSYGGLRRFDGRKFSHSFGDELQLGAGGNKSFKHRLSSKMLPNSTDEDVTWQDLLIGDDIFFVVQDNNEQFFILGAANGMSAVSNTQNTGETGDSDIRDVAVFEGDEKTKKLRFALEAGYAATLAYLEGMEVDEA